MNRKVAKNYIYNTMYQVLVLIAPLITTPYVSRTLGPVNIGIYSYVQSIASYFVLVGVVGTSLYGQREIAYLQDNPAKRSKAFWEIEIFRLSMVLFCTFFYCLAFCSGGKYTDIYRILTFEVIAAGFDIKRHRQNFKKNKLRPHKNDYWCIPSKEDAEFVACMGS